MSNKDRKQQRANAKRNAELTRETLAAAFPNCFAPKGADKRPLAIGINKEIMAAMPELGFLRLSNALGDYTSGPTYLCHVVEGARRIDLNGEPRGVVTAEEAAHAAARLAAFQGWVKANDKAQAA